MAVCRGRSTWSLDSEMRSSCLALTLIALSGAALADTSVVVGKGVANSWLHTPECAPDAICMNAVFLWTLRANQTLSGPRVKGLVRAVTLQHAQVMPQFVRSFELFVLASIDDAKERAATGARFRILAMSREFENGSFCLNDRPETFGLRVPLGHVDVDPTGQLFCFPKERHHPVGI